MPREQDCKHNAGFSFYATKCDEYPGLFLCNHSCGYFLNFSPDHYPYGLAYLPKSKGKKVLPEFKSSGA